MRPSLPSSVCHRFETPRRLLHRAEISSAPSVSPRRCTIPLSLHRTLLVFPLALLYVSIVPTANAGCYQRKSVTRDCTGTNCFGRVTLYVCDYDNPSARECVESYSTKKCCDSNFWNAGLPWTCAAKPAIAQTDRPVLAYVRSCTGEWVAMVPRPRSGGPSSSLGNR